MKSPLARRPGLLVCVLSLLLVSCGGVKNPEGWATPALNGDRVYFFPASDRLASVVVAADGTSVTKAWQFPDKTHTDQKDAGFKASYGIAFSADAVFFGSWDGRFYSVAAADGALRWGGKIISGGVVGEPVVSNGRVFIGTTDGRLYAFSAANGATAPGWPANGVQVPDPIWASPVVAGGRVFAATMGGEVYAFEEADGTAAWAKPFKVRGAIPDLALLDGERLFVPTLNKQVFIVATADGTAKGPGFATDEWVWSRPAYKDGVAYFGDFSGKVYALDITVSPAKTRWTTALPDKIKAAPVLIDNVLVVGTIKPEVVFLDAASGAVQGNRVPLLDVGSVRAGLVAHNGKALIATTNGNLFDADPKAKSVSPLAVVGAKP